ncbi:hypothetical protein Tco_1028231 [Tanacetum coccineum]|uniref:Uncharacterized protein n=1 Tax=Tanacetum coccineum TaxID=301880 RepID=A0ABQ5G000_9ASTR
MKEIDWKKVKITDEVMEYVILKYGKTNWLLNDLYSQIILEDIYNTFYKDEAELAKDDKGNKKVDDKGKGKIDDKGKGKIDDLVDALEKGKSKLMVYGKGTKKASVDLVDALDLQNKIKKLSEDFNMLVKAQKTKEAKEAKIVEVSSDEEDFSDEVPIASTSNAQAASTALRGYMKIALTGCVLGLRAPNDHNAPPPSTTRKKKP